jgi:hypothetical protein
MRLARLAVLAAVVARAAAQASIYQEFAQSGCTGAPVYITAFTGAC